MFGIFTFTRCFFRLGPREFFRRRFKLPVVKFIHDTVDLYKARTRSGVDSIKEVLLRGTVVALITALLVWTAIFMYIAFYYAYVPTISHEWPVHFKFRACQAKERGLCSFPYANIKLSERQRLLMLGQPYRIQLDLEMPESPVNRELGMFMVCADFHAHDGRVLANSCRSAMLHYRSIFLDILYKLTFSPFFVLGSSEEKQHVVVELFTDFEEHETEPVTDILVEIQTTHIEIYSARFLINAHFTGLRFLMYSWPVFSAAIGITSNLFFIAMVCMVSWYQIINSEEYLSYLENQKRAEEKSREALKGTDFDSGSSSSSLDDDIDMTLLGGENKTLIQRKSTAGSRELIEEISSDC